MSFTDRRTVVSIDLSSEEVIRLYCIKDTFYQSDAIADKILRKVLAALPPPERPVRRIPYGAIDKHLLGRRLVRNNRDDLDPPGEINAIRWSGFGIAERCEVQGSCFSYLVRPDGWIEVEA